MHLTTQYLANKEKAVVANSKVEALEAEASGLRKDLIAAMDALNTFKELIQVLTEKLESERQSVKQKDKLLATTAQRIKVAVAKAITAFQTIEEYNTILFQWYFKGFELFRRYLIKHGPGTNLKDLDFEAVLTERLRRTRQPRPQHQPMRNLPGQTKTMTLPPKLEPVAPYQSFSSFLFIYFFFLYVLRLLDNLYSDALPVFGAFLNSLILYNMSINLPLPSWLVDIFRLCYVRIYFWMFFSSLRGLRKNSVGIFYLSSSFCGLTRFCPLFFF